MTAEELLELVQRGESANVKFSERLSRSATNVAKVLVAFANTEGGRWVVGYSEPTASFVGVGDRAQASERLQRAIAKIEPLLVVETQFVRVYGGEALVIDIPRGPLFPYGVDGRVLVRVGTTEGATTRDYFVARITEQHASIGTSPVLERVAEQVAESSARIVTVERRGRLTKTVPLALLTTTFGAVLGYVLRSANPLGGVF